MTQKPDTDKDQQTDEKEHTDECKQSEKNEHADNQHSDNKINIPLFEDKDLFERARLMADNPVIAARVFNSSVQDSVKRNS